MTIDQLSAKYMIPLRRTVMSIFMTRDGEGAVLFPAAKAYWLVCRHHHHYVHEPLQRPAHAHIQTAGR